MFRNEGHENATEKMRLHVSSIRRLLYLPKDLLTPFQYIKLERDTPGPKELAKESEESTENAWTAVIGQQTLVDVFMPSSYAHQVIA